MVPDPAPTSGEAGFALPEAAAALAAHPRFARAMRATASGLASMYHGRHLLNWLMDDRGRMLLGYLAIYLHATRDPRDPSSGLTPTRIKALCTEFDVCSPGRAGAMLSLMRFSGYLAPDIDIADRRQRRLVATDKLYALLRSRLTMHYTAMAPLFPDGAAMLAALDDKFVDGALVAAMMKRYRAGFRLVSAAPELGLFGERNGGMLILASLIAAGEEDDTVPPSRPVPISIAALARRFAVSRPHVLKLVREAEDQGFLERPGPDMRVVILKPALIEAARRFFASSYLFLADSMREAMAVTERRRKAG
ncbi:MAG: hypothetical protein JSR72_01865 [Proteobacteria bacterium]|nr:hypothetical protein [Pseudomonadota bacterium]